MATAAGVGERGGGVSGVVDRITLVVAPCSTKRLRSFASTVAMAPGVTICFAPPSTVATSTAPSTTWTAAPVSSTVTLKVVPLTTAAR